MPFALRWSLRYFFSFVKTVEKWWLTPFFSFCESVFLFLDLHKLLMKLAITLGVLEGFSLFLSEHSLQTTTLIPF